MFLFEFRVYWKNVVWPTRYGFMAEDFNTADEMLINQIKIDAKNMENFSVRLSEYFDELRDLMYIITVRMIQILLKIIMYKCIHKFFCVI